MASTVDLHLKSWQFAPEKMSRSWLAGAGSGPLPVVSLPHCWNQDDTYLSGLRYRRGWGSYRCQVELDLEDACRWFVDVGGFFGSARLWVNGQKCGSYEGRHLGFRVEIGSLLKTGANMLALLLENRHRRGRLPGRPDPDFLLYGGLAGGVRLLGRGHACFTRGGVHLKTSLAESGGASLDSRIRLENALPSRGKAQGQVLPSAAARVVVEAAGKRVVTELQAAQPTSTGWLTLGSLALPSVEYWTPEQPRLYSSTVTLEDSAGRVLDSVEQRVGFRLAEFSADGFKLNGKRYPLHGMNRHQSLPGFGNALPAALERFDAEQIKAFGGNCVRLSHYPQSPEFLDACDELGLFVYAEVCSWKSVSSGSWLREAKQQIVGMIERDRHRPSVLVWGMGNESRSRKAYLALSEISKSLDPRPVCYAENHLYRAQREKTTDVTDVWGVNYELDVLDDASRCAKSGAVLITECMNPCLHESQGSLAEEQLSLIDHEMNLLAGRPEVAGYFVWCYADYATLYRDRYLRPAGLFEATRYPKPGAWLFRARHTKGGEPFVRLFADWQEQGPEKRPVRVISNCSEIELRPVVKGASAHKVSLLNGRAEVEIEFSGEPLQAFLPGRAEPADTIDPWGQAQSLALGIERRFDQLLLIRIEVHDGQGNVVRDDAQEVDLTVGSPYVVRVAGDRPSAKVCGGVAWTWLSSTGSQTARTELVAEASGLKAARLDLTLLEFFVKV